MSAVRQRLPDRRENETVDLNFGGWRYHVTLGFRECGAPGEVFAHGARVGSEMDCLLDDVCVALSLLLQHGMCPSALAHSMGRDHSGKPASIMGAMMDLAAQEPAQ